MEWKPYVGYKDLKACGLSEGKAYKVLDSVMQMAIREDGVIKPWCESEESLLVNGVTGKRVPIELLVKKLPHCKKFFAKPKEKTQA